MPEMTGFSDRPGRRRPGWQPDEMLVTAALSGRVDARTMPAPDRAYLVASLQRAGLTAEDTARRMSVSLRLVRQIMADPLTAVVEHSLDQAEAAEATRESLAAAHADALRQAQCAQAAADRLKVQRDQLIGLRAARGKRTARV